MSILDKAMFLFTPPESEDERAKARQKARAAAEPGDWLSHILTHHEQIEAAFAAVKAAQGAAAKREALKTLGVILNGHSMAEEATVYPALAEIGKTMHAEMAYTQQVAAKMQMAALERLDPASEDFADKFGHLEGAVIHHIHREERDWFPDLKLGASPDAQHRVTKRYLDEFNRYMSRDPIERRAAEPRSFGAAPDFGAPPSA